MTRFNDDIASTLKRGWWALLLRGLLAIAFGVMVFLQPGATVASLVLVFGAFSVSDGVVALWVSISSRKEHEDWWVLLLRGLLGICVGVVAFMVPGMTAMALLFYIAIWAIAVGILEFATAIRLRKVITGEWLLILSGVLSIAFGILLIAQPAAGVLAVLSIIGAYAMVNGVILLMLAFKARRFVNDI